MLILKPFVQELWALPRPLCFAALRTGTPQWVPKWTWRLHPKNPIPPLWTSPPRPPATTSSSLAVMVWPRRPGRSPTPPRLSSYKVSSGLGTSKRVWNAHKYADHVPLGLFTTLDQYHFLLLGLSWLNIRVWWKKCPQAKIVFNFSHCLACPAHVKYNSFFCRSWVNCTPDTVIMLETWTLTRSFFDFISKSV